MHFHLPKPLHGWREFAGEVGIIVLGVLIALGAEAVVEDWRWHAKVQRAEDAMRLELGGDDGPQAYGRLAVARCLEQRINRIFHAAGRVPSSELRNWVDDYAPPTRTWDNEAWKAVLASDIGSHLGAERLIDWSASYRLVPHLDDLNQHEVPIVTDLRTSLPPSGEPSPSQLQAVRQNAAQLVVINLKMSAASRLLLGRMKLVGARVPEQVARALLTNARRMYGSCVQDPAAVARPTQSLQPDLHNSLWDQF